MKKLLIATTLLMAISIQSIFAADDRGVNRQTTSAFASEFKQAKDVSWTIQKGFSVANFSLNGLVMTAYYNRDAALVAVLHHLSTDHLPIFLYANLKSNYDGYWVTELFEAASDNGSHYHLRLENGDEVLSLRSVNGTDWQIEKRVRKGMM